MPRHRFDSRFFRAAPHRALLCALSFIIILSAAPARAQPDTIVLPPPSAAAHTETLPVPARPALPPAPAAATRPGAQDTAPPARTDKRRWARPAARDPRRGPATPPRP